MLCPTELQRILCRMFMLKMRQSPKLHFHTVSCRSISHYICLCKGSHSLVVLSYCLKHFFLNLLFETKFFNVYHSLIGCIISYTSTANIDCRKSPDKHSSKKRLSNDLQSHHPIQAKFIEHRVKQNSFSTRSCLERLEQIK